MRDVINKPWSLMYKDGNDMELLLSLLDLRGFKWRSGLRLQDLETDFAQYKVLNSRYRESDVFPRCISRGGTQEGDLIEYDELIGCLSTSNAVNLFFK